MRFFFQDDDFNESYDNGDSDDNFDVEYEGADFDMDHEPDHDWDHDVDHDIDKDLGGDWDHDIGSGLSHEDFSFNENLIFESSLTPQDFGLEYDHAEKVRQEISKYDNEFSLLKDELNEMTESFNQFKSEWGYMDTLNMENEIRSQMGNMHLGSLAGLLGFGDAKNSFYNEWSKFFANLGNFYNEDSERTKSIYLKGYKILRDNIYLRTENGYGHPDRDKTIHCMVNCLAAELGEQGQSEAIDINNARERFDTIKGMLTGSTYEETQSDSHEDTIANETGFEAGKAGMSCVSSCYIDWDKKLGR